MGPIVDNHITHARRIRWTSAGSAKESLYKRTTLTLTLTKRIKIFHKPVEVSVLRGGYVHTSTASRTHADNHVAAAEDISVRTDGGIEWFGGEGAAGIAAGISISWEATRRVVIGKKGIYEGEERNP